MFSEEEIEKYISEGLGCEECGCWLGCKKDGRDTLCFLCGLKEICRAEEYIKANTSKIPVREVGILHCACCRVIKKPEEQMSKSGRVPAV